MCLKGSNTIEWDFSKYKDQKYKLPDIIIPFKSYVSPYEDINRIKQEKWLKEKILTPDHHDLVNVDEYLSNQTHKIYSNCYPHLSEQDLFSVTKIQDILFILDDCYIELNLKDIEYIITLTNEDAGELHDQFGKEYWIAINEMYKNGVKESVDIFVNNLKECLFRCLENAKKKKTMLSKEILEMTIEKYMEYRCIDVGGPMVQSCVTTNVYIPNEIKNIETFKLFEYWNIFTNLLLNDLISFKKETELNCFSNYVKIKTIQCGTIQESMNYIADMINKSGEREKYYSEKLIQLYPNDSEIKKYVVALTSVSSGHLELVKNCCRYKQ